VTTTAAASNITNSPKKSGRKDHGKKPENNNNNNSTKKKSSENKSTKKSKKKKKNNPHLFAPKWITHPTSCGFCAKIIWRPVGKGAYQCTDCGFTSHKKCLEEAKKTNCKSQKQVK